MRDIISEDRSWLNKDKKAVNWWGKWKAQGREEWEHVMGRSNKSEAQYGEDKRTGTINLSALCQAHSTKCRDWPIFRQGSPESLRGIYQQFRISSIRLGMKWTWVDGLDPVLKASCPDTPPKDYFVLNLAPLGYCYVPRLSLFFLGL